MAIILRQTVFKNSDNYVIIVQQFFNRTLCEKSRLMQFCGESCSKKIKDNVERFHQFKITFKLIKRVLNSEGFVMIDHKNPGLYSMGTIRIC